jgi:hypothetical protein
LFFDVDFISTQKIYDVPAMAEAALFYANFPS